MLEQAHIVSALPLTTIKFHQLQIVKDTVMAKQFLDNPSQFKLFSLDEYIDFIVAFIERLNPDIVIDVITSYSIHYTKLYDQRLWQTHCIWSSA